MAKSLTALASVWNEAGGAEQALNTNWCSRTCNSLDKDYCYGTFNLEAIYVKEGVLRKKGGSSRGD